MVAMRRHSDRRFSTRAALVVALLSLPALPAPPALPALLAQQPVSRLKGRIADDGGARLKDAQVRAEAYFGSAAGTFAGQRTFRTTTNGRGEWSIMGIAPGIWMFDASAPGYVPEVVALPIRLLIASRAPSRSSRCFSFWALDISCTRSLICPVPPIDPTAWTAALRIAGSGLWVSLTRMGMAATRSVASR